MEVLIILPVFNDWESAAELLRRLDEVFEAGNEVTVMFVDDGSPELCPSDFGMGPYKKLKSVLSLVLKTNVGHQRAIAIGLCYAMEKLPSEIIVVMDSDGEDQPSDAKRLVERIEQNSHQMVVFAERKRRSESNLFKVCYFVYKILHRILTGRGIRFGNFSAIPSSLLPAITIEPMLWNHYAASIVRSKIRIDLIPTNRGDRFHGKSHLNFVNLIVHGISALACYNEIIGVRLLLLMALLSTIALFSLLGIVALKLFSSLAIPGWASTISILIVVMLLQIATLISNFVMQSIATRTTQPVLPIRDYAWFVFRQVQRFSK